MYLRPVSQPSDTCINTARTSRRQESVLGNSAAILESWIAVESAARDYIESVGASKNTIALGLDRLPDKARTPIEGVISRYRELRQLRNEAAHANDFDVPSFYAQDFAEEALRIARVMASKTKNE